jgi:heme/copper-type cytochrome/quinol oxidase subunit 2
VRAFANVHPPAGAGARAHEPLARHGELTADDVNSIHATIFWGTVAALGVSVMGVLAMATAAGARRAPGSARALARAALPEIAWTLFPAVLFALVAATALPW